MGKRGEERLMPLRRRKPEGMLPEQFRLLSEGDIIMGVRSGVRRTIISASKSSYDTRHGTGTIRLKKLRQSWTRGDYTTYCVGDASQFIPIKVKNKKIFSINFDEVMQQRKQNYIERMQRNLDETKAKIANALRN